MFEAGTFSFASSASEYAFDPEFLASLGILTLSVLTKLSPADLELVAKCAEKSEHWDKHWNQFESKYGPYIALFVYRELRKQLRGRPFTAFTETTKDLCQDVYINLLKNDGRALQQFRGETQDSFLAYLYTIARNTVCSYIIYELDPAVPFKEVGGQDPDSDSDPLTTEPMTNETEEKINEAFFKEFLLEQLKSNYSSRNLERDIFLFKLYYFKGLSASEIKRRYQVTLSASGIETVVSRMKKALQRAQVG
ncbi:MAG: sigma-70 family RNA polymerase sigma factor [Calditrichaeota bacterium]|nr:MAG: sigma-70 family RNA polymerase sigma factor [Calditrichota bacterium]